MSVQLQRKHLVCLPAAATVLLRISADALHACCGCVCREEEIERQACAGPVLPPSASAAASLSSREVDRTPSGTTRDTVATSPRSHGPPAKRQKLARDDGDDAFSGDGQSHAASTLLRSPLDAASSRRTPDSRGAATSKPRRAPIDDFEFDDDDSDDDEATLQGDGSSIGSAGGSADARGATALAGLPAGGGVAAAAALRSGSASASTGGQLDTDDEDDGFVAPPRPPSRASDDDDKSNGGSFRGVHRFPTAAAAGFVRRPVGGAPGKLSISISFKKP